MSKTLLGIHHVTAICGDAQQNVDFYAGLLGLRMVKRTVNFDDPGMYHFYYGDGEGSPGTIMTFFPIPGAPRGRRGAGEVSVTSFSVPEGSLAYWTERLQGYGMRLSKPIRRFDDEVLVFQDPDGLQLELVAHAGAELRSAWASGPVPAAYAIRGFHSVTLYEREKDPTHALLTGTMGLRVVTEEGNRVRYEMGAGGPGALVDVIYNPEATQRGLGAQGSVHHVAWRVANDEEEVNWMHLLANQGLHVSSVRDRNYFRSVYFREPGGVLFELATDLPGFAVDEPSAELGTHLMLPSWLEPRRAELERALPPIRLPESGEGA